MYWVCYEEISDFLWSEHSRSFEGFFFLAMKEKNSEKKQDGIIKCNEH